MATTSSTKTTQLVIQGAPIDPTFEGDLQQLFEHFLERMRIVAPFGVSTFVTGTQVPTSDQGPLFLETSTGTSIWVWDDEQKTYVPIDVSYSQTNYIAIQAAQPTSEDIVLWFQIDSSNRPVNVWVKVAGTWQSIFNTRGSTAGRPNNPAEGTQYFDTDINVQLIYERSAWRTLSGSPGDVKSVIHATLADALRYNPGWVEISTTVLGATTRGRAIVPAHKDTGTSPVANNPPVTGVSTARAARESFGAESVALTNEETPGWPETHWHATGTFRGAGNDNWYGLTNYNFRDEAFVYDRDYTIRGVRGDAEDVRIESETKDDVEDAIIGTVTGPTLQNSDDYDLPTVSAHNNEGPRYALWTLVKE